MPSAYSVLDAVTRLQSADANRFLGALLGAEVSLQRLPATSFAYTRDERVRDGGVDGRLDLADRTDSPFPLGRTIWQFKSGSARPSGQSEIRASSKRFAREAI